MSKDHIIKAWLKSEGRTARWLASEVGITENHLSRICNDRLIPPKPLILALESVSKGGIPASSWVSA